MGRLVQYEQFSKLGSLVGSFLYGCRTIYFGDLEGDLF